MPNTYELIASTVLNTTATSITFSSIPATFEDLVIRASYRISAAGLYGGNPLMRFNGDGAGTTLYSNTAIGGTGSAANPTTQSSIGFALLQSSDSAGNTANVFTSTEVYIPKYLSTDSKPLNVFKAAEQFSATNEFHNISNLYRGSSGISSIVISGVTFIADSKFYLYGIKKS